MIAPHDELFIYPAKHFVLPEERIANAIDRITRGTGRPARNISRAGQIAGGTTLAARTRYDIEMLTEVGYCPGIENYSRPLSGRPPGRTADTLFSFFPDDFLLFIDESHVTIPQIRAMYAGDRSRKTNLVEHGFRLPSALDNRPLEFEEWEKKINQVIYVRRLRVTMNCSKRVARWWNRSFVPRGCSIRNLKSCRLSTRSATCWSRSTARGCQRTRPGDDADQADGGGSGGLSERKGVAANGCIAS